MNSVSYFTEDISFTLLQKRKTTAWIRQCILNEGKILNHLNYIFCSDDYLLQINRAYLNHDYYTDIITFNQSELMTTIEGDIYISIDRVRENANAFDKLFLQELYRVMIHGVLHLCGHDDYSEDSITTMRNLENFYLGAFNNN